VVAAKVGREERVAKMESALSFWGFLSILSSVTYTCLRVRHGNRMCIKPREMAHKILSICHARKQTFPHDQAE
jgi:hypothetical protein